MGKYVGDLSVEGLAREGARHVAATTEVRLKLHLAKVWPLRWTHRAQGTEADIVRRAITCAQFKGSNWRLGDCKQWHRQL